MTTLMASLLWLLACLSCVSAVPVEVFASNDTSILRRGTTNALQYPYSLQLLLSVAGVHQYRWFIYQGPQGIAVDPCQDHDGQMPAEFKRVFYGSMFQDEDDAINHPPFPDRKVYTKIEYSNYDDCKYIGTGIDAGQFRCGDHYIIDCAKDPGYDEATMKCDDDQLPKFHRGYYCEF
ncbi:unnamed protein product [Alternaria burnsii]|nr:unnamed protein product [Alternaria burnsii]